MKYTKVSEEEFYSLKDQSGLYEVLSFNGYKAYYKDGKFHRQKGPAIIHVNGSKEYYNNGVRHRTNGPSTIYLSGYKEYCVDGVQHRTDGPAVIKINNIIEYHLKGEELNKENFIKKLSKAELARSLLNPENF